MLIDAWFPPRSLPLDRRVGNEYRDWKVSLLSCQSCVIKKILKNISLAFCFRTSGKVSSSESMPLFTYSSSPSRPSTWVMHVSSRGVGAMVAQRGFWPSGRSGRYEQRVRTSEKREKERLCSQMILLQEKLREMKVTDFNQATGMAPQSEVFFFRPLKSFAMF